MLVVADRFPPEPLEARGTRLLVALEGGALLLLLLLRLCDERGEDEAAAADEPDLLDTGIAFVLSESVSECE